MALTRGKFPFLLSKRQQLKFWKLGGGCPLQNTQFNESSFKKITFWASETLLLMTVGS